MTSDVVQILPEDTCASQGMKLGEDIDRNEIFAEYFMSEFEDPLNAYTNSMANYDGAAAAVALAQKQRAVDSNSCTRSCCKRHHNHYPKMPERGADKTLCCTHIKVSTKPAASVG